MENAEPAPRRGRPVSQEKRAAILEAAIAEFSEQGFEHASMDAIAMRSGVSKRTLYNRFDSKEGLFAALVQEVAERIQLFMHIEYVPDRPLREQLMDFAAGHRKLNAHPGNLRLQRAVLAEHLRSPERVEPILQGFWATEYGFESWVRSAVGDGRLKGDPVRISHMMGALMRSLLFWPALLGRGPRRKQATGDQVAEAVDMFLAFYGVVD